MIPSGNLLFLCCFSCLPIDVGCPLDAANIAFGHFAETALFFSPWGQAASPGDFRFRAVLGLRSTYRNRRWPIWIETHSRLWKAWWINFWDPYWRNSIFVPGNLELRCSKILILLDVPQAYPICYWASPMSPGRPDSRSLFRYVCLSWVLDPEIRHQTASQSGSYVRSSTFCFSCFGQRFSPMFS